MKNHNDNFLDTDFYKQKILDYSQEMKRRNLERRGLTDEEVEKVYVIYARKSTTDKEHQQRSIQDQITACKEYARIRNLKYVDIQTEEQTAHKSEKRDVFYEIIKNIKEGKYYNGIIAWHPDRLARNMKDAGEIMDLLDRGIIQDLQFPSYIFTNDASGKMMIGIQFVLAKNYSDNLSNNTKRGNDNTVIEGKYMGKSKHGYTNNEQGFYRPNEHFEIIQKAWNLVLEGTPQKQIKQYFIDNGYKTLGHSTVSRIFFDPFYAGIYIHGDNIVDLQAIDNKFKPMITPKEFITVRQLLRERTNFDPTRKVENILFKKIVKCAHCNHFMTPYKSRGKYGDLYYYIGCVNEYCETKKNKKLKKTIRGKVLMDYIVEQLSTNFNIVEKLYNEVVTNYSNIKSSSIVNIDNAINTLYQQVESLTNNLNGLARSLNSINSKGEVAITDQIRKLSEEIEDKRIELESMEEQKILIESSINEKVIPYKNFLNFFQNAEQTIRTNDDVYLLDQLIRNIFLNFSVKGKKVISHELKEPFATYQKLGVFIMGWRI